MALLENMTLAERQISEQMKKQGYSEQEIKRHLLGIRNVPKEELLKIIEEKMIFEVSDKPLPKKQ